VFNRLVENKTGFNLLCEISRLLSSNRPSEEIISLVVGLTTEAVGLKSCSLMRIGDGAQKLAALQPVWVPEKSLLCVPLTVKDRVIGVLNCYPEAGRQFSQEEIRMLVAVANQAAVAIENARLRAEMQTALEELETRKKVDRAKAILIGRDGLTEAEAHRMLQRESMDRRHTMKAVAEAIILSEELKK
ncbi:MAG: ANTAR domain-containing protein, partial [Candidatus Omnitrophica bacterium]|nr:ANTAR domain-containing protein [Candidatus Omnitrophota bacterium]